MEKIIELKIIEESPRTYDEIEARLKKFFREQIYFPILRELNLSKKIMKNAAHFNALMDALYTGRIHYLNGVFTGKLSAAISKELRAIGASFDHKTGTYRLPETDVPIQVMQVIQSTESHFLNKMAKLDKTLSELSPSGIANQFKCADLFDKTLFKADKEFRKNVKNITNPPQLTPEQRERIATDWQNNMKLWIKDWTEEQIKDLRKNIFEDVMSGKRRESLVPPILKITKTIQESHDQAVHKAKFLAHQETRLLMAKFKEVRYTDAGVHEYIWRCRHRPHDTSPQKHTPGNVRYSHGLLNGKIFSWANPPITSNPGQPLRRNNPGQDYNCFCQARPILRKKSKG